jgi:DNA-binding MarR family transcriptional regulator
MPQRTRTEIVAGRLHSAAIHLLRRLRRQDEHLEIGPARLSALSVLVFGGPCTLGQLAVAEQVKPPTMSRLVAKLERDGLATRVTNAADRRSIQITATRLGRVVLRRGRERRVQELARRLAPLQRHELDRLAEAAELLERVSR